MKLGKQEEEKEGAASSFLDCSEDDSRSSAAVFDIVATTSRFHGAGSARQGKPSSGPPRCGKQIIH